MLERLALVAALLVVVALFGAWWRRREGRVATPARTTAPGFRHEELAAVGLDAPDAEWLALLLGSPTCAPCRSVEQVLTEVARERPGLRWVEVDAADHLDIARTHHVLRVPTLFVIEPGGRIAARTSGVPAVRDLLAVLAR